MSPSIIKLFSLQRKGALLELDCSRVHVKLIVAV
jgi:hypothetical protein